MGDYELQPCPFCGSTDVILVTRPAWPSSTYELMCTDCNVILQAEDKETAYALWNHRYEPPNPPLTLEEMREMEGEPVWCEDYQCWGIVKVESKGPWANQPFLCGVYHNDGLATSFEHDIEKRKLTLYRRRPEDISKKEAQHG